MMSFKKLFKKNKKVRILVIALAVLLIFGAVGGTITYLQLTKGALVNTLAETTPPSIVIEEDFDNVTKSNVKVALGNDGDGSYFIRAFISFTLRDENGDTVLATPVAGTDYQITMGSNWVKNGDFWYYKGIVLPGGKTTNLIDTCTSLNTEYKLVVDVTAQMIQSSPTTAASEQWGYVPPVA